MPTILSHPAVPLAIGLGLGASRIPPRLLAFGVLASIVPDLDVIAFRLGIPYAHEFGHRGASHSLALACLLGLVALAIAPALRSGRGTAFIFTAMAAASHGLLDMLTNGGLGVALWWPWSGERLFFDLRLIEASPLSLQRMFGPAGLEVLRTEVSWIWGPALIGLAAIRLLSSRWGARAADTAPRTPGPA